jgi:RNA polymerase sigma factor for flagellar operon FliA
MGNFKAKLSKRETALIHRIVSDVCRSYVIKSTNSGITREDLYHYGIIGMLEARRNFDASKGVPWPVFAAKRIRGAMIDQLRVAPLIKLPQAPYQRLKTLKKAQTELLNDGRQADASALAQHLGWTLEDVHQVHKLAVGVTSVDNTDVRKQHDDNASRRELASSHSNPEKMTLQKELLKIVGKCLQSLRDPKERLILAGRLLEGLTLKQLATPFGWSVENVRLRQKRALAHMKSCLERHGWSTLD